MALTLARAMPDAARQSASLLRANPVISLALGAAIVLSFLAACTGLGAIVAPWFIIELYALQLAASGIVRPRAKSWIGAGVVVLATVLIVVSTGWLAALGFGPDVVTADASTEPLPWPEALRRIGLIAGGTTLAVGFTAPFLYAPLILIDRGGLLGGAIVESAWLVRREGVSKHLLRTFVVYLLQLSPALVTGIVAGRALERSATPLGLLAALPFLPLTIPLGQGIVTARYLGQRELLGPARLLRLVGRPPRSLVIAQVICIAAPVLGLVAMGAAALRPSVPREVGARPGDEVADVALDGTHERLRIADTVLVLHLRGAEVGVGAAGDPVIPIPRAWSARGARLRVVRARDVYAVEVSDSRSQWTAYVDRAGVRVDDSIRRRLESHVPTWAFCCVLAGFFACALLLVHALAPLGELRSRDRAVRRVREDRDAALRRAWRATALALPFSVAALVGGLVSLF